MLPNWAAGPAGLVAFALLYFLRIPREEQMLSEHYGAEYVESQFIVAHAQAPAVSGYVFAASSRSTRRCVERAAPLAG